MAVVDDEDDDDEEDDEDFKGTPTFISMFNYNTTLIPLQMVLLKKLTQKEMT